MEKDIKNMEHNFNVLKDRITDMLNVTDLNQTRRQLESISSPTLVIACGGSRVVSTFAEMVLSQKNGIITKEIGPRDLSYINTNSYDNILVCSYGARNYGVKFALEKEFKKYLLSLNDKFKNVNHIAYKTTMPIESSFISLGATLVPMSILLDYYLDGKGTLEFIDDLFNQHHDFDISIEDTYELLYGEDTKTAAKFLESTFMEAGLASVIKHEKYDMAHGLTTLNHSKGPFGLINLSTSDNGYESLLKNDLARVHSSYLEIKSNYNDIVLDNYNLVLQAMFLSKKLANYIDKDLSNVKCDPVVKKLYKYEGDM